MIVVLEVAFNDFEHQVVELADAARVYAKRIHASLQTTNYAAEIRLRTQRRLGKLLEAAHEAIAKKAPFQR